MNNEVLNSIPNSESDKILIEWGYNLPLEYLKIINFVKMNKEIPVLDLATGSGRISSILSRVGYRVFTGDNTNDKIEQAKTRISEAYLNKVVFMIVNMEILPFRDNLFDNLVCLNTFHEVSDPYLCLNEIIRVYSGKGKLVITDFNEKGFDIMQKLHETRYGNNHSRGFITMNEVKSILNSNFQIVEEFHTDLNITYSAQVKRQ